jgi:DNA-binding MarR family transcriptional regulator
MTQNEILEQETPIFSNYFHLLSKAQWNIMLAIAKEQEVKNPLSQEFLRKYNLGPTSTVSSALKALEEKEVVIKEKDTYLLHDVLFSRWLEKL